MARLLDLPGSAGAFWRIELPEPGLTQPPTPENRAVGRPAISHSPWSALWVGREDGKLVEVGAGDSVVMLERLLGALGAATLDAIRLVQPKDRPTPDFHGRPSRLLFLLQAVPLLDGDPGMPFLSHSAWAALDGPTLRLSLTYVFAPPFVSHLHLDPTQRADWTQRIQTALAKDPALANQVTRNQHA